MRASIRNWQVGDWQVLELASNLFHVDLYNGKAWRWKQTLTNEEQVQECMASRNLLLIDAGTHGTWPMRLFRPESEEQMREAEG